MTHLSVGVLASTYKKREKRAPLHPAHLARIDHSVRSRMFLESGYGQRFGEPDEGLAGHVAELLPRPELIRQCDLIMMFKATPQDVAELRPGQILWAAPHFAQNTETTQLAIDRKLTVISMEAMRFRPTDGTRDTFVYHRV